MGKHAGQGSAEPAETEGTGTGATAEGTTTTGTTTTGGAVTKPTDPKAPPVGQVKPDPYWAPHDAGKA
jgi:hypothetical protein